MSEVRGEVREQFHRMKQEIDAVSPDAADFPLQWAKIVGMLGYLGTQIAYVPRTPSSTTTAPTLTCPSCGATHTLTLR